MSQQNTKRNVWIALAFATLAVALNAAYLATKPAATAARAGQAPAAESVPASVVERGMRGCPGGYVDHPADPSQCVLPALAQRYTAVHARILAPEPATAPAPADQYAVPTLAEQQAQANVEWAQREAAKDAIERERWAADDY